MSQKTKERTSRDGQRLKPRPHSTFTEKMKKAYLVISSIAALALFGHICFWMVAGGEGALGFMLGTIFIGGIPLLFWFPVALVSFLVALKLPKKKENLKNLLLACPILTLVLLYAAGEYYGP